MKGKYGGPISVDDLFQALYQDRQFFSQHGITHVRSTFLYFTPCDEIGDPIIVRDQGGGVIDGFVSAGGYRSVADAYDAGNLEPQTMSHRANQPKIGI